MTRVYNEIDKVGGDPLKRVVKVELLWDKSLSSVAMEEGAETMIDGPVVFEATVHGLWEIDLIGNDLITPTGSVYKVSQGSVAGDKNATVFYMSIPSSETEIWAGAAIVSKPNWVV